MAGVTIAHQPQDNTYRSTESMSEEIIAPPSWPMEDLTNEVEDFMMRDWLPWETAADTNVSCVDFESQLYAQAMELEGLFAVSDLSEELGKASDFETTLGTQDMSSTSTPSTPTDIPAYIAHSELHKEMIDIPVEPIHSLLNTDIENETKGDVASVFDSDSDNDDDQALMDHHDLGTQSSLDSSEEESDGEDDDISTPPFGAQYMFMHKRQLEETLLMKITQQLDADKLPGILSIVSFADSLQQSEEVELDLSCLAREQLIRVLSYVEACLAEQAGGPVVNIANYKEKPRPTAPAILATVPDQKLHEPTAPRSRRRRRRRSQTDDEPIESAKPRSRKRSDTGTQSPKRKRARRRRTDNDNLAMSSSVTVSHDPDSIASSRPKRQASMRKSKLKALLGSEDEEEADHHSTLVVLGDEQMDLRVTDNQTIAHQPTEAMETPYAFTQTTGANQDAQSDADEEIDIML